MLRVSNDVAAIRAPDAAQRVSDALLIRPFQTLNS
jgi:hypothetical protein